MNTLHLPQLDALEAKVDALTAAMQELTRPAAGPEWLTLQQVAEMRKCTKRTIQNHIKRGILASEVRGGRRMVHRDDV